MRGERKKLRQLTHLGDDNCVAALRRRTRPRLAVFLLGGGLDQHEIGMRPSARGAWQW
jgi:hypothetical protein